MSVATPTYACRKAPLALLFLLILTFAVRPAQATVYTFTTSGNWSDLNNWQSNNIAPGGGILSGDQIIIQAGATCNFDWFAGYTIPDGCTITVLAGATFRVNSPGQTFHVEGDMQSNGAIEVWNGQLNYEDGLIDVFGSITVENANGLGCTTTGALNLRSGSSMALSNSATASLGGTFEVYSGATVTASFGTSLSFTAASTVVNNGTINCSNTLTLNGLVSGSGIFDGVFPIDFGGHLQPGSSGVNGCVTANAPLTFASGAILTIETEGTTPCSNQDQLQGSGSLTLDGVLNLVFTNGYMPTVSTDYMLISNSNSISGSFSVANFPAVPNGTWTIDYNSGNVMARLTICTLPDVPTVTASQLHSCVDEGVGESVTLSVSGGQLNDATDWYWYESGCGSFLIGTGVSVSVQVASTTTYYVRGEGGCVTNPGVCGNISITTSEVPEIYAISAKNTTLCGGNPGEIAVEIQYGTSPFSLVYFDGANQTFNGYASETPIAINPAVSTTYSVVSVTDANGCIDNFYSGNTTITVLPSYSVSVAAGGPTHVCNGGETHMIITSTGSGTLNFMVDISGGEGPSESGYTPGTPYSISPPSGEATSVYTIFYVTDDDGCHPVSITGSMTVTQDVNDAFLVQTGASGTPDGLTWATAFTNLHAAFHAAEQCPGVSEIWVGEGVYYPAEDITGAQNVTNRENTFKLSPYVAVYGGFPATGTATENDRDPDLYPTILSGDIGISGNNSDNVFHVVYAPGTLASSFLDGFTIRDGNANQPTPFDGLTNGNAYGGGILFGASGTSVTVNDCVLSDNTANYGGGMATYGGGSADSSPNLTNCTLEDNVASSEGGGVYVHADGAISHPTFTSCLFENNLSVSSGGGMAVNANASGSSYSTLTNCVFTTNSASTGNGGALSLTGLSGNGNLQLTNCLLRANSAVDGGGIYLNQANCNLNSSTLYANTATATGGAAHATNSSILFIQDCILWGNTATTTPGAASNSSTLNIYYTLDQGGDPNTGNINTDPLFIDSSDPDGIDDEWFTNDDGLRISPASPARDAANPITNAPLTDLSGLNRVGVFDMGAYEYSSCVPLGNADHLYVDATLGADGLGTTWATGYMNLTNALQTAHECPQITEMWVASGTYRPSDKPAGCTDCSGGREMAFRIPNKLAMYGGFDNTGTATLLTQRNPQLNPTILSGDLNGDDGSAFFTDNTYHVVLLVDVERETIFDGFTVTGGYADGAGYNSVGSRTLYQNNGGGICMHNARAVVENCLIEENHATSNGGGIYSTDAGSPIFTECDILSNTAGSFGGGLDLLAQYNTATLSRCLVSGNSAGTGGGGLSTRTDGVYTLERCVFADNTSQQGGGIFAVNYSWIDMTNTVVSKNICGTATNGMLEADNATINILHSTFVATGVAAEGTCIYTSNGTSNFTSSIFWNATVPHIDVSSLNTYYSHNTIQNGPTGSGNIDTDPLFVNINLGEGGDGIWFTTDDGYALQTGSPAIDAGDPAVTTPTTDLLRVVRVGIFDMGAYEAASLCTPLGANTRLYVDDDAVANGVGTDWATAYQSLGDALKKAFDCNQIIEMWVAEGIYIPTLDTAFASPGDPRTATFRIPSGLALYGGFNGSETLLTQQDAGQHKTILSGDLDGNDTNADNNFIAESYADIAGSNSYHVVRLTNVTATTQLNGVLITGGKADGSGIHTNGGGIYNNGAGSGNTSNPTLTNCTLSGNYASIVGGGMYNHAPGGGNSSPVLSYCTISGNHAGNNGGGILNYGAGGGTSSPTLTGCTFSGNSSDHGAALANHSETSGISSPSVSDCVFAGNAAGLAAGGVQNSALTSGVSSPVVTNCVFWGNSAANVGASMWNNGSGGGTSAPLVTNCTFAGNSSTWGVAGIHNQSASPTLVNCIIWGNTSNGSHMFDDGGSTPSVTYSVVELGYPGTGNISTDPMFMDAADPNGSDDLWLTADDGLRLMCGSSAVNTGTATGAPALDVLANSALGIKDMGPYERASVVPARLYVNQSGTGTQEGNSWADPMRELRYALACQQVEPAITEIWVAAGEYMPATGTNRSASFVLKNGLALYGGFAGNEATLGDRVLGSPSSSTLNGDIGVLNTHTDDVYHVVRASGVDETAILNGFRIKHGNADSLLIGGKGGGLLVNNASPLIEACTFDNNLATFGGGVAIVNPATGPVLKLTELKDCTLTLNTATNSGGGIYAEQMIVKFSGTTDISNNTTGPSACE